MEDKVFSIVNYRRKNTCWVCCECETENQMDYVRCLVCGVERNSTCKVCVPWEVEQERIKERVKVQRSEMAFVGESIETPEEVIERYVPEEKSRSKAWIWILIFLVLIVAGVCVYLANQ